MMGRHDIGAQVFETFLQIMRYPLSQPTRIDKDQGRAVLTHEFSHAIVDIRPDRIRGDGTQLILRHFDSQIQLTAMADIDNDTSG